MTKKKATPAATPTARTVTADETELLDIVRPVAWNIISANRERTLRHLQGGLWSLDGMVEVFGSQAFWMPEFWRLLSDFYPTASADPKRLAALFPEEDQVANVESWRVTSDEKRKEMDRLHKVLLGERTRGRVKDKPAKDYAARAALVEAKTKELRAKGEKRPIGKAQAIVALDLGLKSAETLRKDKKRAKRGK